MSSELRVERVDDSDLCVQAEYVIKNRLSLALEYGEGNGLEFVGADSGLIYQTNVELHTGFFKINKII